jgi:hypothetical protein
LIYLITFVLVLSMAGNASAGLLVHWKFDEGSGTTAYDSSGNGHHGTLEGDPEWVAGKIGGALDFGGDGDRVVDEDAENYLNGLDAVTVCIWIKSDVAPTDKGFIICEEPDGGDQIITMRYDAAGANGGGTSLLKMAVVAPNDEQQLESSSNLQVTEWQHVAMVWSRGAQIKFYVNGLEDTPQVSEPPSDVSTSDVTILIVGQGAKDASGGWDGLIDDVRIYDEALTEPEIQAAMKGEKYPYALGPVPEDGAVHLDTWASLSWKAGCYAVSHNVYFGDNFEDVDVGADSTFRGNETSTSFIVGLPGHPFPDGLVPGTTYYWRIDEVNDLNPNNPWRGPVWSFCPAVVAALEEEPWPLIGRNKLPDDATLFLHFWDEVQTTCDIHVSGNTVQTKGKYRLLATLPRRSSFIYVELIEGRGYVCVYQDPCEENGYEAIISVQDVGAGPGRHEVRVYYSQVCPEDPPFISVIRIPNAPQPYHTTDGRFMGPMQPQALTRPYYNQDGRFWGEKPGPVCSLIDWTSPPAFHWEGQIDEYAVLGFDGVEVKLFDCGLTGSHTVTQQTNKHEGSIEDYYLVLSECTGPGRVRVIQPMNVKDVRGLDLPDLKYLIEIDDRDVPNASDYSLTAHLVPKARVDGLYLTGGDFDDRIAQANEAQIMGDMSTAASHWAWIAAHTREEQSRLWAIEKFCMLQPYRGPAPNPQEEEMLNILQNQALEENPELRNSTPVPLQNQLLEVLLGKNIILAWPKDYTAHVPTKWRFLAELDACMEWLKEWTGNDEVQLRRKRMIARFRVDEGGTALYVSFRLHIPRREMRKPPDHEPYSHEVSHGYVYFPAISPTGQFNEGLTEVSRTGYWHFLGLESVSVAFRQKCLIGLMHHMCLGGTVLDAPGYAGAASLYFVLMENFCRGAGEQLDWYKLTNLYNLAKEVEVDEGTSEVERWQLVADLCERAFGEETRSVLTALGLPVP